jgi:hypothetical protein
MFTGSVRNLKLKLRYKGLILRSFNCFIDAEGMNLAKSFLLIDFFVRLQ